MDSSEEMEVAAGNQVVLHRREVVLTGLLLADKW